MVKLTTLLQTNYDTKSPKIIRRVSGVKDKDLQKTSIKYQVRDFLNNKKIILKKF